MSELENLVANGDLSCSNAHDRVQELDTLVQEEKADIGHKYHHVVEYKANCLSLDYDEQKEAGSPYWEHFLYFLGVWKTDWACVYEGHQVHDDIGESFRIF